MTLPMIFNFFAIKIHGVDAADLELDVNLDITDTGESRGAEALERRAQPFDDRPG